MKYGFSFNGTHSNSFPGLTVKTASRPVKPEVRENIFTVPYADGAFSTADKNPYGRAFYQTRAFTMNMLLTAENLTALNKKLAKISLWLSGPGELIFDDTPLIAWDAAVSGSIDYAPERAGRKAVLSVTFTVQPFGRLIWSVCNPPEIGVDGIYLSDNLPLGDGGDYSFTVRNEEARVTVVNYGVHTVRPVITVTTTTGSSSGAFKIAANGKTMSLFAEKSALVINCAEHTFTDSDGNNLMLGNDNHMGFSGQFIELNPGHNEIDITGSSTANLIITFDFRPEFLWDADFDASDWGD